MSTKGNPQLITRVSVELDSKIEARIALAIAKATKGPKDRADFLRRAASQYLRKLERSSQSRRRRKPAFVALGIGEAVEVDNPTVGVYTYEHPEEDRATLASDPSASGASR